MSAPGGVLSLDLSTRSGWCYGAVDAGEQPLSGVWQLPPMSDLARCWVALENELGDAIVLHQPCLVFAEAPLEILQSTARLLLGLASHAMSTCYRFDTDYREQSVNTIRRAVLGRASFGNLDPVSGKRVNGSKNAKAAVLAWCHQQGWLDILDHNEADAAVGWTYAVRELRTRRTGRSLAA